MGPENLILYKRKNHLQYSGLILPSLPPNFKFCFGINSTEGHGLVTTALALKILLGVTSGRQGQSYDIVTIALLKDYTDPKMGISYDEHFLTPPQMKANFREFYGYTRQHPDLTFVVSYSMHTRSGPKMGTLHNV